LSDRDLVEAARQGDSNAFKELVRRFEPVVAATVIGMLGNCTEAEDVGQETFIRFYKSLKNFRGDSSVRTYLTRIAMNLSLNEIKRRRRRRLLFSWKPVEEFHDIADPKRRDPEDLDTEIVSRAIQGLEEPFRAVIVLRLIDGYSTRETADILDLPVGTVLSRLSRAQKKLREILPDELGDSP
jgi:RNA polymerase sigma-70 factor (ECF subfamily)